MRIARAVHGHPVSQLLTMIDQSYFEAAIAVVAVYVALVAVAHLLKRVRGLNFRWTYHVFALALALLVGTHLLPAWVSWRAETLHHLMAGVFVLAALPLVTLLNRMCWIRYDAQGKRIEAPRVLIDLTGVVVVLAAVLATMQFVYDVKVPGLLAGSGVAALVLGLGMQDQLKNMFAGLALYFEKPFAVGDWLLINGVHARVIEISWRSTRLLSSADVQIEIDNGSLLNQTIYNFQRPTPDHAVSTTIGVHYDTPPAKVIEVLRTAAASVPGVLQDRPPVVYLKNYADSAIEYEINVRILDHAVMNRVLSDVRSHSWYALKRAGIEMPYPQMVLHRAVPPDTGAAARQAAAGMLRAHKIFGCLTTEQCEALVQASPVVKFATHEHLLVQGATGDSMFVLVRGAVDVRIAINGEMKSVAKLGAGDCVGEMSLLTGDLRTATVVAEAEVEAVEIGKAVFGAFVRSNPAVIEQLGELLAQRQLANAKLASENAATTPEQVRSGILGRLRAFFALD
jgi:small-conductance mechanosensitive channel/CRP-like cAMP-binding protein